MKKVLLAVSVAALFAVPVMAEEADVSSLVDDSDNFVPVALADNQGLVNFSGKLQSKTCQIKPGQQKQQVNLPTLDVQDVKNGNNVGSTEFTIELVNCSSYKDTSVALKFTAPAEQLETVGSDKVLKNKLFSEGTNNQGAGNVGLKVMSLGNTNFNVLNDFSIQPYHSLDPFKQAEAVFKFSVEYATLNSSKDVTPGTVAATLPFTVEYK